MTLSFLLWDGLMTTKGTSSYNRSFTKDKSFSYFDISWNVVDITWGTKKNTYNPDKPKNFDKMNDIVKKLSSGMPHVRVDLYNLDGIIYFGEFTFF